MGGEAAAGRGGVPLALLPGHLCDLTIYRPQIAALGLDPALVAETRLDDDLAAMARRFLAAAPPRVALIGLSMGGMLAMEILAQAPERIVGAALLNTDAAPAREKEIDWRAAQMSGVAEGREGGLEGAAGRFIQGFFRHSEAAHARLGPELRAMAATISPEVYFRQARALSGRRDRLAALAAYDAAGRGPLLALTGAEDRLCPPLPHRRIKEAAPGADLVILAECGHLSTLEAPQAVNAALAAWRARLPQA